MWLLSIPLAHEDRITLPKGRYGLPPHYDAVELSRNVEFFAGIIRGVKRHLILPSKAARSFLAASSTPNLRDTLLAITFNDEPFDNELDEGINRSTCEHVLFQFPQSEDINYAWQERYLKRDLLDIIRERTYDDHHPLAPFQIVNLPVLDAAGLTTEALELMDLLEGAALHRLERAEQGTSVEDYRSSLHYVAGRRFVDRMLRLLPHEMDAALEVLRNEGAGGWLDERFRLGAEALQKIGLARIAYGSALLVPMVRPINEAWLQPLLQQLASTHATTTRRWLVEAAPTLTKVRRHSTTEAVFFTRHGWFPLGSAQPRTEGSTASDPPAPLDSLELVEDWVTKGKDFKDRCARAFDFLSDPDRKNLVRTNEHTEYELWEKPLRLEFTHEEWEAINRIYTDDEMYDETIPETRRPKGGESAGRSAFRGFKVLERKRFGTQERLSRQVDAFLEKQPALKLDLARWMAFALFEGKFVSSHDKSVFVDLLSWIWCRVLDEPSDEPNLRDEGNSTIRRCMALALKYQFLAQPHIEDDVKALGLELDTIMPAGDRKREFVLFMKSAFEKMLNGTFVEAKRAYEQAGAEAKYAADIFEEWVALQGEKDAAWRIAEMRDPDLQNYEDVEAMMADYDRRIQALGHSTEVAHWLKKARSSSDGVREFTISELREANRRRLTGANSMSYNASPHEYWTLFRDLETIYAPPAMQHRYARPLIDLGGFDAGEEFRHRLRFGIDKAEATKDWLSRITNIPTQSAENAQERDRTLIAEFTRPDTFKRERLQRLKVFPAVAQIFRLEDLDWARGFLSECKDDAMEAIKDVRFSENTYVEAVCAYAELDTRIVAIERLESCGWAIASWHGRHAIGGKLRGTLPLLEWIGLHENAADKLARLTLGMLPAARKDTVLRSDEDLAWALARILQSAHRFNRSVSLDARHEIAAWVRQLLEPSESSDEPVRHSMQSAATHLAYLVLSDDAARAQAVEHALAWAKSANPTPDDASSFGGPFATWVSLVEVGENRKSPAMIGGAETLWENLQNNWETHLGLAKRDADDAWAQVSFLSMWLASGKANHQALVRHKLRQLLDAAPTLFGLCADALDPAPWGDAWPDFVALLRKYAMGGRAGSLMIRLAIMRLLRNWANPARKRSGELSGDVSFLVDVALWAISDESHVIANHAAHTIANCTFSAHAQLDVDRISHGLRQMAIDPRLGVRSAAAYMSKRLPFAKDAHDDIRAVALELDDKLAKDPYALIQRQRVFGELDRKFPPRD